ncbi:MAG: hypothetical protein LUE92_04035 [Clostridiales bacterium]|nr:hypothetical protein [Clostridiales bacterium]
MLVQFQNIPWLPGLVAALYLLMKKKTFSEMAENVVKVMLGCYMILAGAWLSSLALGQISEALYQTFGVQGVVLNTEIFGSWLLADSENYGFLAFFTAFFINLLIARLTKKHYLYLTGHHLFFLSLLAVSLLWMYLDISFLLAALAAGVVTGVYAWLSVRVGALTMRRLKPGSNAGLANSATGAALLGSLTGWLTRGNQTAEAYGKNGRNAGAVTSMGVFTVLALALLTKAGNGTLFTWDDIKECCILALLYGAALSIITQGIRMCLRIFIQMFWDIGRSVLPEMIAGLDSTALVSYSPAAWQAGFVAAGITGTLTTIALLFV